MHRKSHRISVMFMSEHALEPATAECPDVSEAYIWTSVRLLRDALLSYRYSKLATKRRLVRLYK